MTNSNLMSTAPLQHQVVAPVQQVHDQKQPGEQ